MVQETVHYREYFYRQTAHCGVKIITAAERPIMLPTLQCSIQSSKYYVYGTVNVTHYTVNPERLPVVIVCCMFNEGAELGYYS